MKNFIIALTMGLMFNVGFVLGAIWCGICGGNDYDN